MEDGPVNQTAEQFEKEASIKKILQPDGVCKAEEKAPGSKLELHMTWQWLVTRDGIHGTGRTVVHS